jgi:hypothetical protein
MPLNMAGNVSNVLRRAVQGGLNKANPRQMNNRMPRTRNMAGSMGASRNPSARMRPLRRFGRL